MATKSVNNATTGSTIVIWDYSSEPEIVIPPISTQTKQPDAQAKKCYQLMKTVDTFFQNKFSICIAKDAWNTMTANIHCRNQIGEEGSKIPARWYSDIAWFGDVDPKFFAHSPACNLDIVAHEFGHAVTQNYGRLTGNGQSGALNESISDVFAIAIKHDSNGIAADSPDANWFIADGFLINKSGNGTAIRSLSHPGTAFKNHEVLGTDHQVSHFDPHTSITSRHRHSGIPNHAFYLAATKIGGPTWKTAEIWYEALRHTNNDDFATFASRTLKATKDLGRKEPIYNIIAKAWRDVGIDVRGFRHEEGKSSTPSAKQSFLQEAWNTKEMVEERRRFVTGMVVLGVAYTIYKAVSWLKK